MAKKDILEFAEAYKTLKDQFCKFIDNLKAINKNHSDFITPLESGDEQKFFFSYLNILFVVNFEFRFDEADYIYYGVLTLKRITKFKKINNAFFSLEEQEIQSKSDNLFDPSKHILFSKTGKIINSREEQKISDQLYVGEIFLGWLNQFIRSTEFKDTIQVSLKNRRNPNV